ncbi:kinase-like domain-containing protein [Mycena rebaudengoi]|nr:kinase-like domain-containing protein [Mycena rebaudengoi]
MSDDLAVDPYNDLEQLQKTEEVSHPQSQSQSGSAELWGYLSPCLSRSINRVDLHRDSLEVTVGRSPNNQVMFPGLKISNYHAVIQWNGLEYADSVITIEDKSSNGTFINGEKIGKGRQRILKDGNEVAFGVASTSTEQNGLFDYRFIFRDLVPGVVKRELYKSYDMSVELGKGSSATVYKALHMASGQWVAVKVIHKTKHQGLQPSTASEAAQIGRSRMSSREIDIMETLRHPNICLLREAFWNANGSIDLVLELVEGGDLLDFILMNNGLTEAMTKHMTFQLCQALSYIHSRGITHRNLKPENILLTKDHPPIVKVADFGLAGIVDSMIMLKIMPGTPFYLAPEVVSQQNNSEYDSLVDSWSVGVIVFSMLTNTSPFLANSMEDLKTLIAQRNIDWVQLEMLKFGNSEEGYYGLSDEVHDFIRQLLDFDPRQRMKLSDALSHPWLKNHKLPFPMDYPRIQDNMKISLRDINGKYVDVPVEDCRTWQFLQLHSSPFI